MLYLIGLELRKPNVKRRIVFSSSFSLEHMTHILSDTHFHLLSLVSMETVVSCFLRFRSEHLA